MNSPFPEERTNEGVTFALSCALAVAAAAKPGSRALDRKVLGGELPTNRKWVRTLVISGHCPHKNPIYNQATYDSWDEPPSTSATKTKLPKNVW